MDIAVITIIKLLMGYLKGQHVYKKKHSFTLTGRPPVGELKKVGKSRIFWQKVGKSRRIFHKSRKR